MPVTTEGFHLTLKIFDVVSTNATAIEAAYNAFQDGVSADAFDNIEFVQLSAEYLMIWYRIGEPDPTLP